MEGRTELETVLPGAIVATEDDGLVAALERRIRELEEAIGELRSVKASAAAAVGRKTSPTVMAEASSGVDGALASLSVEQRIAVKSGLMRAGVL